MFGGLNDAGSLRAGRRWCSPTPPGRAGSGVGVTGWFEPRLVMLLPRNVTVTLTAMTNLLPHARHRVPLHGEPTHGTHSHCILEPHRRAAPGARGRLPAAPHASVGPATPRGKMQKKASSTPIAGVSSPQRRHWPKSHAAPSCGWRPRAWASWGAAWRMRWSVIALCTSAPYNSPRPAASCVHRWTPHRIRRLALTRAHPPLSLRPTRKPRVAA